VSPPRRRALGGGGRRSALGRRDLEALLRQLDNAASGSGKKRGSGRASADRLELDRLRALVTEALADKDAGGAPDDDLVEWDEDDLDDLDDWDEDEDEEGRAGGGREPWASDRREEEWDPEDDEWEGWSPRRSGGRWERFAPSKPIPVEGGLAARSRRGEIGSTWWSKRFLSAIESVMVGGRLGRGRTYARQGQVLDLRVDAGLIEAQVQGSRATPYRVRLAMPVVPDADWDAIVAALAAQAGYAARMLAGELPPEVEDVFSAEGASLFPAPHARITTDCTCPDWANPCKHVAAVCYLVAEAFDRDPFAVLAWRGRDREAVLRELRRLRATGADAAPAPEPDPVVPAVPAVEAPPLGDCLLGFWKAGPALAQLRVRPEAAELPGAVLRHLPPGLLEVKGRDVGEVLGPAYADFAAAAARRALREG